jgi:hypothetical protein
MQKHSTKTTSEKTSRKEPTAHAQAGAVMEFMNSRKIPDFLSTVVMETIDRACEYLDPHQAFKPYYEEGSERHDRDILIALCRRTRMLRLAQIEESEAGLARHIKAILEHPNCPNDLFNKVADWVTTGTNVKDADGESLIDRWAWAPETLTAIVNWTLQEQHREEDAKMMAGGAQ